MLCSFEVIFASLSPWAIHVFNSKGLYFKFRKWYTFKASSVDTEAKQV